jgi:hypothetical protein
MDGREYVRTSPKKGRGRGMAQASLDLMEAMRVEAEKAQPITVRGIGYKLFARGLIPSMSRADMAKVYRLGKEARERGIIPWEWIVDETRSLEKTATWANIDSYAGTMMRAYRRDNWNQQPVRCEIWSEKGTVRGVLKPVLDQYGIGFRVMHGFSSATTVWDVAQDDNGKDLIALYVGDYDPSGLFMSQEDLPKRLEKYEGHHVMLDRIALTGAHISNGGLLSFPATDKAKDPRYQWFRGRHGERCWELDALDPNELRDCVEKAIKALIDTEAWERCEVVNLAEQESLKNVIGAWRRNMRKRPLDAGLEP